MNRTKLNRLALALTIANLVIWGTYLVLRIILSITANLVPMPNIPPDIPLLVA